MIPRCLYHLFLELRRRGLALAPDDFAALHMALWAGFGWESREALCAVLTALWAKSRQEQVVVRQLFDQVVTAEELAAWQMTTLEAAPHDVLTATATLTTTSGTDSATPALVETRPSADDSLGNVPMDESRLSRRPLLFVPQFPLAYREVAQTWRRLRRPVREGPRLELDVQATIAQRSRLGLSTPAVFRPRRRNTSRLLLLVDRQGSMTPFHSFVAHVCAAMCQAAQLGQAATYYFHDQPATGADRSLLDALESGPMPALDPLLPEIAPLEDGVVYGDADFDHALPLAPLLATITAMTAVVVLSDAGAARGHYDLERLLDTVAFLKALRRRTPYVVWINPLPPAYWPGSTAAQIARHVPMLPLDKDGLDRAVHVLRGGPYALARPL